jgi:dethiobiotin synthetase
VLHAASGGVLALNEVNPVWLRAPASPYTAAIIEERPIDVALITDVYRRIRAKHSSVVVEGVGGWRVPITRDYYVSDLAAEIGLPVVVVVANRLGAINHTLLTIEAIALRGQSCAGIILNGTEQTSDSSEIATTTNRAVLESLVDIPIICEVKRGQNELSEPI